jgi:hypothetical protein
MCGIIGLLLADEDENVSQKQSKQCNAMHVKAEEKDGMLE